MKLEVRAYDEGVAFRYLIEKGPTGDQFHILSEQTEFRFTHDHDVWAVTSAQGKYDKVKLSQAHHNLERPCVLETADDKVIAVAEAALVDYARMRVRRSDATPNTLISRLHGPVNSKLPLTTPWRVIMAGDTAGELLPLYQSWGIAGIKYGFVQHGSQQWTAWMHDAIRKTADHKMLVDVHDEYRMTGWERTYPNFMTKVAIESRNVSSKTVLQASMGKQGGVAMRIVP